MTDFSSNHSRRISLFTSSLASKVVQFIRLDDTMEYVRFNVHMSLLMVQKHTNLWFRVCSLKNNIFFAILSINRILAHNQRPFVLPWNELSMERLE